MAEKEEVKVNNANSVTTEVENNAIKTAEKMLTCYYDSKPATYDVFLHDKYYTYKDYHNEWNHPYFAQPFKLYYLSKYAENTISYLAPSISEKLSLVSYYPSGINSNPTK